MNLKLQAVLILIMFQLNITGQDFSTMLDSTLNNLVHPPGYTTCKIGELGKVQKYGSGSKNMILIPGIGFGGGIFNDFIERYKNEYTIYIVTPAGFDNTPAPDMPDSSVKYAELSWTNGIVNGIIALINKEKIDKPVIIGHFITATQAALNLALNYPDKIGKVIIMGGAAYRYYPGVKDGQWNDWQNEKKVTLEQRSMLTETWWAPKWFKFVTKKTWDENMWTPSDYCADSVTGQMLFKTSADVPLQVMIRYLIEWGADDPSEKFKDIKVPLQILIPDFTGIFTPSKIMTTECEIPDAKQYLKYFHQSTWEPAKESSNPLIKVHTIPNSRIFMWLDNPVDTYKEIDKFLN